MPGKPKRNVFRDGVKTCAEHIQEQMRKQNSKHFQVFLEDDGYLRVLRDCDVSKRSSRNEMTLFARYSNDIDLETLREDLFYWVQQQPMYDRDHNDHERDRSVAGLPSSPRR